MATYERTQVRTRRDAWKLDEWDPIILWYANAIAEMQTRPLDDPTSWRYQAAIHEYIRQADPLAAPTDNLPPPTDQTRFWTQCQHFNWYFLPWHRIYLAYFEDIVASIVESLGGPSDWALPYWNYSDPDNPNARRLPPAFRQQTMPDGRPNPLFVADRDPLANGNTDMALPEDVDLSDCMVEQIYEAQPLGGSPGFGGSRSGFAHANGIPGMVERVPHGSMHVAVGGWMAGFNTAGLDPIFWLHHCNIDRLWSVWLARDSSHANPSDAQFLTSLGFDFHDAQRNIVTDTPGDVVDTMTSPPNGYQYEDISDPLQAAAPAAAARAGNPAMNDDVTPEMVGATEEPITLTGQPATTRLSVSEPTGPARLATPEADTAPRRVYLNVENITGTGAPTSYAVYLNVPAGENPEDHPELYAGLLPMFGVAEATRENEQHAGSGLNYVLEVTNAIRELSSRGDWSPDDVQITFVPRLRGVGAPGRAAAAADAREVSPIQVGRVSLYFA